MALPTYQFAADVVVVCHFLFIIYAVGGGFLVLRWPKSIFLHLPCAVWAVWIEFSGRICPLTPLENQLRWLGEEPGYAGSFVERYLLPIIYPSGLTRQIQFLLGGVVILMTAGPYFYWMFRRFRSKKKKQP